MDDFYTARSSTKPPLPWTNFAPPFSRSLLEGASGVVEHGGRNRPGIDEEQVKELINRNRLDVR
ncbi:hypothetical protein C9E81_13375 [Paracoccus alkanivorans]|uniref:Uncharacterized protein n=1 Tax=Paracoccus alkanivorans TaxID=2116655 RepID=A0A3M0MA42_9RHOB|nr:hypothetical protein C9E81_13375 [Paracoccus alkanivorans]